MHRLEVFTDDYNAVRLVCWESFENVQRAIAREKQLKNWRREKKLSLIASFNPGWKDLAAGWYDSSMTRAAKTQGPSNCASSLHSCARDDRVWRVY